MDIFVKELDTGYIFQFPMLPEKINLRSATRFLSYDIMSTGEVKFPDGEELTIFSWEGILPGEGRKGAPYIRTGTDGGSAWVDPQDVNSRFSIWRNSGRKLLLTIPGTTINHAVYLEDYQCTYTGGMGDVEYSISFALAKEIIINIESNTASAEGVKTTNTNAAKVEPAKTYTVRQGDSLWKIAQSKLGNGNRWKEIYNLNKATIDARNKGRNVDPYTIYAGQTLNLPAGSGGAGSNTGKQGTAEKAASINANYAGTYTVVSSTLELRAGAGTNKEVIQLLYRGMKVTCDGSYTRDKMKIWYLVKTQKGEIGFCDSDFLKDSSTGGVIS